MSQSGTVYWVVELPTSGDSIPTIAEVEEAHITQVLQAKAGNMTQAAKALGIDRRTLYRKLRGKVPSDFR